MSEPFEGVYAKLSRADEHLVELRQLLSEHLHDPELLTGTIEWRAADKQVTPDYHVKGLPPKVQVVIGDVTHNLRSALEHSAWQLVLANGGTPGRKTHFPICATAPTSAITIAGGVSETAEKVILAAQPYMRPYQRDHPLAVLNYISNVDKHRLLAQGNHGVQDLIMWCGDHDPGTPWCGRLMVGKVYESTAEVMLVPEPGHEAPEAGGEAVYRVEIEFAAEQNSYRDLLPTLDSIAISVRDLVDELMHTLPV